MRNKDTCGEPGQNRPSAISRGDVNGSRLGNHDRCVQSGLDVNDPALQPPSATTVATLQCIATVTKGAGIHRTKQGRLKLIAAIESLARIIREREELE